MGPFGVFMDLNRFVRSFVLVAVLIGVAVGGFSWAVAARTPPKVEKKAEPTVTARTVALRRETRRPVLFLIGRVEARDYATMNAPIEADVQRIAAREGEYFRQGERLVEMDLRELELNAAAQAARVAEIAAQSESVVRNRAADESRLAETERQVELAERDYARNQSLFEKKVLSLRQLEQSEQTRLARQSELTAMSNAVADYETQQRRLDAQRAVAEANLEQMRLLMNRAELRAPFAGRVARVHAAVGARPARGTPLLEIFNPARLRLRVAIAQRYAAAVKGGALFAEVDDADGGRITLAFAGLEPRVEAGNSSLEAFFSLPRGDWVLGAVHDVVVALPPVTAVAAAPVDAIYNDRFVYRVNAESRAESVGCARVGLTRGDAAGEVLALVDCPALADGDAVVADQLPNLLSGVLLNIIDADG